MEKMDADKWVEEARGLGEGCIEWLREGVRRWPREVRVHVALARALRAAGRLEETAQAYYGAIRVRPDALEAQAELAELLEAQGKLPKAAKLWADVLRAEPGRGEWWRRYGEQSVRLSNGGEALRAFGQAVQVEPGHVENWFGLARVYELGKRHANAEEIYRAAAGRWPGDAEVWRRLAAVILEQGRAEESRGMLVRMLEAHPENAALWRDLGFAWMTMRRFEEAEGAYRKAVALEGGDAVGWHQLGRALRHLNRLEEAVAACDRAIEIMPTLEDTWMERALALLTMGELGRGFAEYEHRMGMRDFSPGKRKFSQPAWDGEGLGGKTIVLWGEQGMGDTIQFLRYVPLVAARGGRCVVEVQHESLRRLAEGVEGVSQVVVRGEAWPECAVRCSLMSLPRVFGTELKTVPTGAAYVRVTEAVREKWAGIIGARDERVRVGLVWAGASSHTSDAARSMGAGSLRALAAAPGVAWYSLQKSATAGQKELLAELRAVDWMDRAGDFLETAGLIEQLDLVIGVDTSVVHLAGAMGKAAWVLVGERPDWRWMLGREDSPWYPAVRLIRQRKEGEWGEVVERVAAGLREFMRSL